jgi:bacterioferritin-associated ferredoxin
MYVCICNGITDTQIEAAIDNGAETMRDLSNDLNIGSQCGKCCQCAKRVMNKKLIQIAELQPQVA